MKYSFAKNIRSICCAKNIAGIYQIKFISQNLQFKKLNLLFQKYNLKN